MGFGRNSKFRLAVVTVAVIHFYEGNSEILPLSVLGRITSLHLCKDRYQWSGTEKMHLKENVTDDTSMPPVLNQRGQDLEYLYWSVQPYVYENFRQVVMGGTMGSGTFKPKKELICYQDKNSRSP